MALLIPIAIFVVGVTGSPPMTLRPISATLFADRIETITVAVTNQTDEAITPQYFLDMRTAITHPWVPVNGDSTLRPHEHTVLVLHPRTALEEATPQAGLWIFSTTDNPAGMSARQFLLPPSRVLVYGIQPGSIDAVQRRRCFSLLFSGHNYSCNTQLGLTSVT
jgi:hypothetical protein